MMARRVADLTFLSLIKASDLNILRMFFVPVGSESEKSAAIRDGTVGTEVGFPPREEGLTISRARRR